MPHTSDVLEDRVVLRSLDVEIAEQALVEDAVSE